MYVWNHEAYWDDTNVSGVMQVTRPLRLRLRLEVEVCNGLKTCYT